MFFKRAAAMLSLTAFVGITTVTSSIVTLIAPSVILASEWTLPGSGTFQFQGKSVQITGINYQAQGKSGRVVVNLSDGRKMLLMGESRQSNGQTILVIQTGGFGFNTENHQADISGRLNLNIVSGNLRSLNGSVRFDSQPISINFTSGREKTYRGAGNFQFQGKTTPITSVLYTEGSGNYRVVTLNLQSGLKMRLEGDLNYSKGQPVLVIQGGGFSPNSQADTTGRLNLNLVKGNLRSLRGSAAYDGQPILVNFTCS